jgi:hypothetical protein
MATKRTIGEWFKGARPTLPTTASTHNAAVTAAVMRPIASIVPQHQPPPDEPKLKDQVNALCRHVHSWYFDLRQQLSAEFDHDFDSNAPLDKSAWQWTLEATRRAWPTCVRYMTRDKMAQLCGWKEPRDMARTLLKSYGVTRTQIREVAKMPQRSVGWFAVREGFALPAHGIYRGRLISSSTVGEWLGDKYGYKADRGLKVHTEMLYEKKFDENNVQMAISTQRGTAMEPLIMEQAVLAIKLLILKLHGDATVQVSATEVGLEVCYDEPNIGVSSDGRFSIVVPQERIVYHYGLEMKCKGDPWTDPYDIIKPEYFDQIQLTMYVQKLPRYLFTCHSARGFSLEVYEFKRAWWPDQMKLLRQRYWGAYWPSFVMKTHGLLNPGDLLPSYHHYARKTPTSTPDTAPTLRQVYGIAADGPALSTLPLGEEAKDEAATAKRRVEDIARLDDDIDYAALC